MKRWMNKVFSFCCLFCLCMCFLAGHAAPAIAPDSSIRSGLESLFTDPPQVHGYPYQQLIETAAAQYGLPLPYVLAVVRGESFFDPKARSAKGALGLMQVLPSTASDYGVKPEDLLDPATNIDVGVRYLADLHAKLQDPYLTLAAYYCGCGGVDKAQFTLREDCDEYVHYIHAHLQKVLERAKGEGSIPAGEVQHFLLARFDNFLDAERFLEYLSRKLPRRQLDIFRNEVTHLDHVRYQYQILVADGKDKGKSDICKAVEESTGFSFCWEKD
ncbi:MAG: lytic transglycosylase domain-containing protein [Desulfobacterales bacterium]|nr:lytic transglycosylase domain-containing protein [Desulfobacterales bacterium]